MFYLFTFLMMFSWNSMGRNFEEIRLIEIKDKLIKHRGELRNDYPAIKLVSRVKNIASYSPISNEIILEKKAYELCLSLGEEADDALAFLISHELTHFFQQKDWSRGHGRSAFIDTQSEFEFLRESETEADKYGAFMMYLAGYDYYKVAPRVIELLYDEYSISRSGEGYYPSMNERKKIATEVCELVKEYVLFFRTANYLQLTGYYDWSQSLYEYLLKFLDLPELYTNAGVNQLKSVLALESRDFKYPLILKYKINLREDLTRDPREFLLLAEKNLTTAAIKNPVDYDIFINLAVAKLKLEKISEAQEALENLTQMPINDLQGDQVRLLEISMEKNDQIKLKRLETLKDQSKYASIKQLCGKNIDILLERVVKGDLENAYISGSFTFEPWDNSGLSIMLRPIDESDALFPLNAEFNFGLEGIYIQLSREEKFIKLWIPEVQENPLMAKADLPQIDNSNQNPYFRILAPSNFGGVEEAYLLSNF